MIKLRYQFKEGLDLNSLFDFQYGPEELPDGTIIEFHPVSNEGILVAEPFRRSTILVARVEDGNNWYEARFLDQQFNL